MEKFEIFTGKTIELALESALKQLNLDRDSVSLEVLENPKSGFLGIFGVAPAKIKVTYEAPDEEEPAAKPALSSASRTYTPPKKAEKPAEAPKPQPKEAPKAPKQEAPKAPKQEASKPQRTEKPKPAPKAEQTEETPAAPAAPKVYPVAAPGSVEEQIEVFLKGLLEHMGSDAVPHAVKGEGETYQVELVGQHLGMLIGRRGDTLDAIQHITNYVVNRGASKRARVNVDAEGYREKREQSLERLAVKVAGKVVKYRRNMTLEPMNAYERHVIHATLQEYPDVTTYSTGTEPNRRVVVAYSKFKNVQQ
jgi:spoIIIJ-associated protein